VIPVEVSTAAGTAKFKVIWNYGEPKTAHCKILTVGANGETLLVASGVAKCSKKEKFNSETGRKISLTRALSELFPNSSELSKEGNKNQKQLRAKFWASYHSRKKGS